MPETTTCGEQILETVVAGPDGANRLSACTGIANVQMSLTRTQEQTTETRTFLVGPTPPHSKFHRAIGMPPCPCRPWTYKGRQRPSPSTSFLSRLTGTMNLKGSRCA